MNESKTINVLSIDAWADGEDGWHWNNWHKVGTCDLATCDRQIAASRASCSYGKPRFITLKSGTTVLATPKVCRGR